MDKDFIIRWLRQPMRVAPEFVAENKRLVSICEDKCMRGQSASARKFRELYYTGTQTMGPDGTNPATYSDADADWLATRILKHV